MLGYHQHTRELENYWQADHARELASTAPVPVMGMYEHSRQMGYGTAAATHIDAFFQNIQWETGAARIAALPKAP
ncbi:Fe-Mn family superoxide dismutase [Polaromonas sp. P2-4]|nr:Fe-Mn family superoxide dismutase [Polaromonas sp. P2-4]